MATLNYFLSSSRAGRGSVVIDAAGGKTSLIPKVGVAASLIAPGAAAMDGATSVAVTALAVFPAAAAMDGTSAAQMASAHLESGAGNMDGAASAFATGLQVAGGVVFMDGRGQMVPSSATVVHGVANMDGVASEVVVQSVPGAGLMEANGTSDMIAVTPNYYNLYLQDGVIGSDADFARVMYHLTASSGVIGGDIPKPKMHYRWTFQHAIVLHAAPINRMKFVKILRDVTITMTPSLAPHSQYSYVLNFPISVRETPTPKFSMGASLIQNLLAGATTSDKFIWGRILTQAFTVSTSLGVKGQYQKALAQLFKLSETEGFILRHPTVLNQVIDLSLSLTGGFSLKLLQKLLAGATASPAFRYHFGLTSGVRLTDTLEHLVSEILTQLFTVHPAINRQFIADSSLAQLLTIHPALNNKLVLKLVGDIQLSPEQLVSMLYVGDELLDGIEITALYISPSGTTTTWAVNTRTNAVTEYMNYDFRSFTRLGDRYVAAGPEGLYELDGDTDDGALIISDLMGGYLQLNDKKLFGIKGAYVAIRGGGRFYLKLIAGDGREYVYELKAQPNLMSTKIKIGKGLNTTYMAWELVTEGQDFDLDSIEFIPMTRGRRV